MLMLQCTNATLQNKVSDLTKALKETVGVQQEISDSNLLLMVTCWICVDNYKEMENDLRLELNGRRIHLWITKCLKLKLL